MKTTFLTLTAAAALALTIMFGLTFGTVITMILVPVFYAALYRIPSPQSAKTG